MKRIKAWYARLSNSTKAGINTAWQSSAGAFVLTLAGWFQDVIEYFDSSTQGDFPSISPVGKAAGSAAAGLLAGLLALLYRKIRPVSESYDVHDGAK